MTTTQILQQLRNRVQSAGALLQLDPAFIQQAIQDVQAIDDAVELGDNISPSIAITGLATTLTLNVTEVSAQDTEGNFYLRGSAAFLNLSSQNVRVDFFLSSEIPIEGAAKKYHYECTLDAENFPATWNLKNSYPQLPGYISDFDTYPPAVQQNFLESIDLNGVELHFSSYDFEERARENTSAGFARFATTLSTPPQLEGRDYRSGLNFKGSITPGGDFWAEVNQIKPGLSTFSFFGSISEKDGFPFLEIGHSFEDGSGSFPNFSLGDNANGLSMELRTLLINSHLHPGGEQGPGFGFEGGIVHRTEAGTDLDFGIRLELTPGMSVASISGEFADGEVFTPNDLIALFKLDSLGAAFPDHAPFNNLGLRRIQLVLQLSPSLKVSHLEWEIATSEPWELLNNGRISLSPRLIWSKNYPMTAEDPVEEADMTIIGLWKFGYSELQTVLIPSDGTFYANLHQQHELDPWPLFDKLLPTGIHIPDFTFADIEFTGNYQTGDFSFEVLSNSEWTHQFGGKEFGIRDVVLSGDYISDLDQFHGSASGDLILAGWVVTVEVTLAEQLSIELRIPETNVSTLAEELLAYVNRPVELPDFVLTDLDILLVPTTGHFRFSGASSTEIQLFDGFDFTLSRFQVERNPDAGTVGKFNYEGLLELSLNLGGVPLLASASYQSVEPPKDEEGNPLETTEAPGSEWVFSIKETGKSIPLGHLIDSLGEMVGLNYPLPTTDLNIQDFFLSFNTGNPQQHFVLSCSVFNGDTEYGKISLVAQRDKTGLAEGDPAPKWQYALSLKLALDISLRDLPLIGEQVWSVEEMSLHGISATIASKAFSQVEANALLALLPPEAVHPPAKAFDPGISLQVLLRQGDSNTTFTFPVSTGSAGGPGPAPSPVPPPETQVVINDTKWFNIHKKFRNVAFDRIGIRFRNAEVSFLIDATLDMGSLKLGLLGLGIRNSLNEVNPSFNLDGLSIDYKEDPLEIGGGLLRTLVSGEGGTFEEFDGAAVIKTSEFSLSALGSYARIEGEPSLFLYAYLEKDLGGPAFFFVKGLAAGFGYNRRLVMPALNQVGTFPLVEQARNRTGTSTSGESGSENSTTNLISNELRNLQRYIPIENGRYFLAAGVRFTTFELIDSFALLSVNFGQRFEVDIVGNSKLLVPPHVEGEPKKSPLALVEMNLEGSYVPDEGYLNFEGQLSPHSYVFSKKCHLTGGFAFSSWFKGTHEGDFVQTVGGYHPRFRVPGHYPTASPVSFHWKVDKHTTVKGKAYYALTPHALMAGGALEATWSKGHFGASFKAGADMLLSWKPYHYDISFYVHLSVSARISVDLWLTTIHKTITAHVGADLRIWGPDFSGKAHIDLSVVSFDVKFGANASRKKPPVNWDTFRKSFLPQNKEGQKEEILAITAKKGLIRPVNTDSGQLWLLNPKGFEIALHSVFPANQFAISNPDFNPGSDLRKFGIGPMGLSTHEVEAKLTAHFYYNGDEADDRGDAFEVEILRKPMPSAMWGTKVSPKLNAATTRKDVPYGLLIRPIPASAGSIPEASMNRKQVQFHPDRIVFDLNLPEEPPLPIASGNDDYRRSHIRNSYNDAEATRTGILTAFGIGESPTTSSNIAHIFIIPPQVNS